MYKYLEERFDVFSVEHNSKTSFSIGLQGALVYQQKVSNFVFPLLGEIIGTCPFRIHNDFSRDRELLHFKHEVTYMLNKDHGIRLSFNKTNCKGNWIEIATVSSMFGPSIMPASYANLSLTELIEHLKNRI